MQQRDLDLASHDLGDKSKWQYLCYHLSLRWDERGWAQGPILYQESQVNKEVRKYPILSAVQRDTCVGQNTKQTNVKWGLLVYIQTNICLLMIWVKEKRKEINNRKLSGESVNIWKLNSTPHKPWIKEEMQSKNISNVTKIMNTSYLKICRMQLKQGLQGDW